MSAEIPKLDEFQKKLEAVEITFSDLLKEFGIENGVSMEVKDGKIRAFIDVEQFRKS